MSAGAGKDTEQAAGQRRVPAGVGRVPAIRWGRRLGGVRGWAVVAGVAGLAADVSLVLFFAVDQPWRPGVHGTGWLGPTNDVLVVVQFAALVPPAVRLRRGALLGVPAMVAVVLLQVLLVAGVLSFEVQVVPVTVGIALVIGWVLLVSRRARLPRRAARVGTAVSLAYFAGLVVVLASLLLPWGSTAQRIGFGLGGLVGGVGFLGFGVWPLWLAEEER
ncbi:hypothetical protein [Saccharothrix variisporea]|uniref:Uncharacterized protein n=1 Tax=Saccharothrix variisporea TaxID=543527 RepID=A0A495XKG9_9PSEU|nr:hypothetical protein [Saccharothrix variisporea]RKT75071.1 hypothetical protein DFJ66_8448 [Saccharothrix variisporea]